MDTVCEQLQYSCERHLNEFTAMNEIGDSLGKCLALTAELKDFEKRSKVSVDALIIISYTVCK